MTIASWAIRGGGCLQGHCCCYSVHCPIASCCYGNRPFWASHFSAWQCPMLGLLRATELFGRPLKALTWNTGNCLSFEEVIKHNLTRSDPACAPDSGALGKLWLGSGLGGTSPPRALLYRLPTPGHCSPYWTSRQERGPVGEEQGGTPSKEGQGRDLSTLTVPLLLRQHTQIFCKTVNMA